MKYFSYSTDIGFEFHDDADAARETASDELALAFSDEWPEGTADICWGEVTERATFHLDPDDDEDRGDYLLEGET